MKTIWTSAIAISLTGAIAHSTEAINLYNGSGLPADNSPQSLVPAAICASNSPPTCSVGGVIPFDFSPNWGIFTVGAIAGIRHLRNRRKIEK